MTNRSVFFTEENYLFETNKLFQLNIKQENVKKVLCKLATELSHINPNYRDWIEKQKSLHDGAACELLEIRNAQEING